METAAALNEVYELDLKHKQMNNADRARILLLQAAQGKHLSSAEYEVIKDWASGTPGTVMFHFAFDFKLSPFFIVRYVMRKDIRPLILERLSK